MSNLIEMNGIDWFSVKFNGSVFMFEGEPHMVGNGTSEAFSNRSYIKCLKLGLDSNNQPVITTVNIQHDDFSDVSMFSIPNLGWRSDGDGKYLAYIARNNNSYHRGLCQRNTIITLSPMTKWLMQRSLMPNSNTYHKAAYLAAKPTFYPFTLGVQKMARGEIVSFAASSALAVMPHSEEKFSLLFKRKRAGYVYPDGRLELVIPELNTYLETM